MFPWTHCEWILWKSNLLICTKFWVSTSVDNICEILGSGYHMCCRLLRKQNHTLTQSKRLTFQFFSRYKFLSDVKCQLRGEANASIFGKTWSPESLASGTLMLMTWIVQGNINSCYQTSPFDSGVESPDWNNLHQQLKHFCLRKFLLTLCPSCS